MVSPKASNGSSCGGLCVARTTAFSGEEPFRSSVVWLTQVSSFGPSQSRPLFLQRRHVGRVSSTGCQMIMHQFKKGKGDNVPHFTRRFRQFEQPFERPPLLTILYVYTVTQGSDVQISALQICSSPSQILSADLVFVQLNWCLDRIFEGRCLAVAQKRRT